MTYLEQIQIQGLPPIIWFFHLFSTNTTNGPGETRTYFRMIRNDVYGIFDFDKMSFIF